MSRPSEGFPFKCPPTIHHVAKETETTPGITIIVQRTT